MPITLHTEKSNLLRLAYEGKWTWDEFYKGNQAIDDYLAQAETTVNLIIDLTASNHLPRGALTHLRNIKHDQYPNFGISVIVTNNVLLKTMGQMMGTIRPKLGERIKFTDTLDAAYELLAQAHRTV